MENSNADDTAIPDAIIYPFAATFKRVLVTEGPVLVSPYISYWMSPRT